MPKATLLNRGRAGVSVQPPESKDCRASGHREGELRPDPAATRLHRVSLDHSHTRVFTPRPGLLLHDSSSAEIAWLTKPLILYRKHFLNPDLQSPVSSPLLNTSRTPDTVLGTGDSETDWI